MYCNCILSVDNYCSRYSMSFPVVNFFDCSAMVFLFSSFIQLDCPCVLLLFFIVHKNENEYNTIKKCGSTIGRLIAISDFYPKTLDGSYICITDRKKRAVYKEVILKSLISRQIFFF